jgi:hypothetical protein
MKYNKTKYLTLLKYSQKLDKQEKHIDDESRKDFLKLREYSDIMINHLHWENREHYFELIILEHNDKSEEFDDLIDQIIMLFDRYCPDPIIREDYEFSKEELKHLIRKIFIEMKNNYPLNES